MKQSALILLPMLLFAGCKTVVTYDAKLDSSPAKPVDHPIHVYTEKISVPRRFEVIGHMHVGDTFFTTKGGSIEGELKTLLQNARQKGADAVKITSIETPDITTANYRIDADFLRFTDEWESVGMSNEQMLAYLKSNEKTLDPLEGIWSGGDPVPNRVGIVRNTTRPGRDFIAFILDTKNPSWKIGSKKMDIRLGERAGVYRIDYYMDDYTKKAAVITFSGTSAGRMTVSLPDDTGFVIFTRE